MTVLDNFANEIFDEHFNIEDYEGTIFENMFDRLKEEITSKIRQAIINEIPYETYEEYLNDNATYEVNLLYELTPFISSRIKSMILWKYHSNDYFNSESFYENGTVKGVSDIYYYRIPDDVVESVLNDYQNLTRVEI